MDSLTRPFNPSNNKMGEKRNFGGLYGADKTFSCFGSHMLLDKFGPGEFDYSIKNW
jgi:hypothetical protein